MASQVTDLLEKLITKSSKDKLKTKLILPLLKELNYETKPYIFILCSLYATVVFLLITIIVILILLQKKLSKISI